MNSAEERRDLIILAALIMICLLQISAWTMNIDSAVQSGLIGLMAGLVGFLIGKRR